MSIVVQEGICPNHGLVMAQRNNRYDVVGWFVTLLSAFEWSADTPYRCPTCGRLTAKAPAVTNEALKEREEASEKI